MRTDTGMQYAFYLRWPTDLLRCNLQLMACYHVWHMRATNRHPARWICIHQAPRQRAWHPPHPRQGRCVLNATTGMTGSTFRAQSNILLEHLFPLEATSPLLKAPNSSCGVATPRLRCLRETFLPLERPNPQPADCAGSATNQRPKPHGVKCCHKRFKLPRRSRSNFQLSSDNYYEKICTFTFQANNTAISIVENSQLTCCVGNPCSLGF